MKQSNNYRILNLDLDLISYFKQYPKIIEKEYIIMHDTGVQKKQTVSMIDEYHRSQGFDLIGYDIYIDTQYTYETKRLYENIIGAHTKGWNEKSIGICLSKHGNNNAYQFSSLRKIIDALISLNNFTILFHKDLSKIRSDPDNSVIDMIMSEYPNNAKRWKLET